MIGSVAAGDRRQQALALDAVVGLDAGAIEHGRGDVERAGERIAGARRPRARLGPDERHVGDRLEVRRSFQHQPVIAEKIAVVGGEDHHRILGEAARLQAARSTRPIGVVDHRDHAAAQRHRLARLALVDRERGLLGDVGLAARALRQRPGDRPGERPVAVVEVRRQRHVLAAGTSTSSFPGGVNG